MTIGLRIQGGDELAKNLLSLSSRLSTSIMNQALTEGGGVVQKRASELAPRDPGAPDLADNIGISPIRKTEERGGGVAIGPTRSFYYGKFLEFGTAKMGAQPFMRPAFDETQRQVLNVVGSALWAALIRRGLTTTRGSGGGGRLE